MKLNKLTFRNLASYGEQDQVIEFPQEPSFFLVQGDNGAGKSTISDSMQFLWYGKVDGKNKKDLVNRLNGGAYVKGEAMIRGRHVVVERGISPNVMKMSIDGEPYDKANAKVGPSDYLEQELLEIPAHVFNNAICLSIKEFKSFLKMSAKDKRLLIDRIFAFQIITEMKETLTKLQTQIKRDIDQLDAQLMSSSRSYDNSLLEVEALTKKLEENNSEQIILLQGQLEKFTQLLTHHQGILKTFLDSVTDHSAAVRDLNTSKTTVSTKITGLRRQLGLYANKQCPTCQSDLTNDFHTNIKVGLETEVSNLEQQLQDLEEQFTNARNLENEQELKKRDFLTKGSKIEAKIAAIKADLQKLNNDKIDSQLESINKIVDQLKADIVKTETTKGEKDLKASWFKILENALSDKGGIKQLAMQTITPAFNAEIYRMMGEMHLNYQVIFDEQFDAQIMHLGEEISPSTLSAGESVKVDFVILVSFIRLLKMKFPSINVMFLDEIFASVDQTGIHDICAILKRIVKELGLNIFVVSHAPLPIEVFEYKIDVKKENSFSNLKMSKIE